MFTPRLSFFLISARFMTADDKLSGAQNDYCSVISFCLPIKTSVFADFWYLQNKEKHFSRYMRRIKLLFQIVDTKFLPLNNLDKNFINFSLCKNDISVTDVSYVDVHLYMQIHLEFTHAVC